MTGRQPRPGEKMLETGFKWVGGALIAIVAVALVGPVPVALFFLVWVTVKIVRARRDR